MKKFNFFIYLLVIFTTISCGVKDLADNDFATTSEVTPIAESRKLADSHGDGSKVKFKLKIPLTENSIGYYDVDEVLGNSEFDSRKKNFLEKIIDSFKLKVFNFAIKLGISNRIKFTSTFEFPEINPKYVVSAKVKKFFFTTEDCRPEDEGCNSSVNINNNFNIVDELIVNIKPSENRGTSDSAIDSIKKKDFDHISEIARAQEKLESELLIKKFSNDDEDIQGINLLNFQNKKLEFEISNKEAMIEKQVIRITKEGEPLTLKNIYRYLNERQFNKIVKKVKLKNSELVINLYDSIDPQLFLKTITSKKNSIQKRMFIFRLNSKYTEAKTFFKNSLAFKPLIKDMTMIGRSLYIELKSNEAVAEFQNLLTLHKHLVEAELDIFQVNRCVHANCLEIGVKDINFIPLIVKHPKIDIDSYFSIQGLYNKDFKYNGYIEVEVLLDLPI